MKDTTKTLGEALLPIVEESVKAAMDGLDIESQIKNAIGDIPTKKLEIVNLDGVTKKIDNVHQDFEELVINISTGYPVLMQGESGVGKTHWAIEAAKSLGLDYEILSVTEQTPISTFRGFIDANGNPVKTPFWDAFVNGKMFIMDEADAGDPNTLLEVNTAISNGVYAFAWGKEVMHPDFRFVATANTFGEGGNHRFSGRNKMDEATIKRFIPMIFSLDEDLEEIIVGNNAWLLVVRDARRICREVLDNQVIGQRESLMGARMLAAGQPFERVFQSLILNGKSQDDQDTLSASKKMWAETAKTKKAVKVEKLEFETIETDGGETIQPDPEPIVNDPSSNMEPGVNVGAWT